MTQREDGQWRALKNDELMRNKMHLGDVYKTGAGVGVDQSRL
nr:hypothetical protein [Escherichia coli]